MVWISQYSVEAPQNCFDFDYDHMERMLGCLNAADGVVKRLQGRCKGANVSVAARYKTLYHILIVGKHINGDISKFSSLSFCYFAIIQLPFFCLVLNAD